MNPTQKKILDSILALRRYKADIAAYRVRTLIAGLAGLYLAYQEIFYFSLAEFYLLTGLSILPAIGLLLPAQSLSYQIFRYLSVLFDSFLVTLFIYLMTLRSQAEYVAYTVNFVLFFLFLANTALRADPWLAITNGLGNVAGYLLLYFLFAPQFDLAKFSLNRFHYDILSSKAMELRVFYLVIATILTAMINQFSKRELISSIKLFMEKSSLEQDLQLATKVQRSLLPSHIVSPLFRIVPHFENTHMIGGDFYDIIEMREGHRGIFICDVSGHGVASALVAAALKMHIQQTPYIIKINPLSLLKSIDEFIYRQFPSHHLSAQYFYINPQKREIIFANAGHPYPILLNTREEAHFLVANGSLLGLGVFSEEIQNCIIPYESGNRLLIYTDGIIESMNPKQEMYGMERLLQVVKNNQRVASLELIEAILKDNKSFTQGLPIVDDLALVVVELL